ncbi:hypothetical protein EDD18DRAFT_1104837 [Armillaria luteobubalina]|uniref:CxC2-like cysteine cluster KDZ transposase-associated domain-containing protein n=1 Tax=Armillaria luteobubalina TaxID=153913 RepID=A0AA39Q708_9AGAR|nr:hypothetical protein EDD18DRAFT_1104837 [Armillaria luteobubalina]
MSAMMEQPRKQNFKHATGFGPHKEEYLRKNAVSFHLFNSQHTFFADAWFDTIWKDFVLYWPPEDGSNGGLRRHHECVKKALQWSFNNLDLDFRERELELERSQTPQVYPPGESENQRSTVQHSKVPQPIKIFTLPTPEERAKDMAVHVTKRAVKARMCRLEEVKECQVRRVAQSQHIQVLIIASTAIYPVTNLFLAAMGSWSFPGPSGGTSTVKHGFVKLPVSPQKNTTDFSPDLDGLSPLPPGFHSISGFDDDAHEQYHLDPEALQIDDYLAKSMRREGRGDAISQGHCPGCDAMEFGYHCITCRDARLFCQACVISLHVACPTHIIQHWNGTYFDKVGHLIGKVCPHPHPAFGDNFTIIDTNGIHNVALDFCSCMLTMVALKQFQMLTFMGKISAYEYYYSLARLTDNTNTKTPSDNYDAFVWIIREWSFIRQLKRAGIGNDPGGWKNAKPALCAVECLACLRPGMNIPDIIDPHEIFSPDAWVYTLYLGIDGNFCLQRFDVSSEEKDPGLGKGLAYCVDPTIFRRHLQEFDKWIIQPASTCSNHKAAQGDKRMWNRTRDLAASGVGGVICTRHELKLPLSTVDLRVGETQVEMDFGYLSAVKCFNGVPHVVMSYDIACQWSINLEKRIEIYGNHMRP